MKLNWFVRRGIIYLPISIPGWLILALATGCAVYTFIDLNSSAHSVSDLMISFIFNLLIIGLVYTIAAYFTENRNDVAD